MCARAAGRSAMFSRLVEEKRWRGEKGYHFWAHYRSTRSLSHCSTLQRSVPRFEKLSSSRRGRLASPRCSSLAFSVHPYSRVQIQPFNVHSSPSFSHLLLPRLCFLVPSCFYPSDLTRHLIVSTLNLTIQTPQTLYIPFQIPRWYHVRRHLSRKPPPQETLLLPTVFLTKAERHAKAAI